MRYLLLTLLLATSALAGDYDYYCDAPYVPSYPAYERPYEPFFDVTSVNHNYEYGYTTIGGYNNGWYYSIRINNNGYYQVTQP